MTIYVTVDHTYMKQVTGLCGTFTNRRGGNRNYHYSSFFLLKSFLDDLELPDGSLSTSVTNFANEWRTDSGVSHSKL